MGCKGSLRMTVIETANGLVIYSPVALSSGNIAQVNSLGEVTAIIAPNLYHHMFLRACSRHFPSARLLIPSGLQEKIGHIANTEIIEQTTTIADQGQIDHFVFTGHRIRETILFHRPSATLITADLLYNYSTEQFLAERLWFRMIGCYGSPKTPFYHRFSIEDRNSVQALIETVTQWQPARIVMSHGSIFTGEAAAEVFARAWTRLA